MEILYQKDQRDLLSYLPYVKLSIKEWLFVDMRVDENENGGVSVARAAEAVHALFKSREGKIYVCNDREILMIVRWGKNNPNSIIADSISKALPEEGLEVFVHEPTMTGISKLEILITYKKPAAALTFADVRATRRENVILVADDDMYMRTLVKKAIGPTCTVAEAADGKDVIEAYRRSVPDIVLLDIHMPNIDGTELLQKILALDPKAWVVMLSADSSRENVKNTTHSGAKGFLTKPFTKEKLQEYLNKCPTIY